VLLARLTLTDFRNYHELDLAPTPGLNVFIGPNAQGKSNLLEGIALLGTGKSFRTSHESDAIRNGAERALLSGTAALRSGSVELACAIERLGRGIHKRYSVNGNAVRYAGYLGKMRVVTFVPADLHLATGAPGTRRAFLNIALSQSDPRYYYELARYRKIVQQKNALLRGAVEPDAELLDTYDRSLRDAGAEIMLARAGLVQALAQRAQRAHARFAGGERLDLVYEPDVPFERPDRATITAALEARLLQCRDAERVRKSAIAGPHRDDVVLRLDGISLAAYGSQGQQRTAVLAMKLAEYGVMRERAGEAPLLLLDDVLSELDEDRAAAFVTEVGDYEQTFITATHLPPGLPTGAHIARVSNARVESWALC
jgi:DNA replication and repair protein RecF